jgi:Motility quorum-sensing regulator, toxin of MqsA
MPRGLAKVLTRIRALAAQDKIRFTLKALRELAALGLDARDARETLAALKTADFVKRFVSAATGERLYLFKPRLAETAIYLKLVLRDECVVVSFHEDENGNDEESA